MIKETKARKTFEILNYILLGFYALIAVFPLIHLGAISLSKTSYAEAGAVTLFPMGFNIKAYEYVFSNSMFFTAFLNSLARLILGVPLNMLMICLAAYPLSRPQRYLRTRSVYSWFFVITMLFSGGLVPTFILVTSLKLQNSVFALILPGAVPVFSLILMTNFFRQLPHELHEAAQIDGAKEWTILFKLYIPLSLPSVITLTLFSIVAHWNSWLDGILYMNTLEKMPLQAYLQSVVINNMEGNIDNIIDTNYVSQVTVDAARLFLAVIPIAIIYFPLQKFFIKGLTLGGVKG